MNNWIVLLSISNKSKISSLKNYLIIPILGINIETERKECFNKINKIIENMARWESNLKFSVGANSKLPSTHAPTEKMRKSKGI